MEVFRITSRKWAGKLTASGFAARWNSNGVKVVYSAASRSLACLENVVHHNQKRLLQFFRVSVIYIPDDVSVEIINLSKLPAGWHVAREDGFERCRKYGDRWVENMNSAILCVPSAIVKNERNFLLNPSHPEFSQIRIVEKEPFFFDPRIKK